jgi:amicyanin
VVTGIDYPIAAAFGPDGGFYVGFPAFGGDDVTGGIIRIDVASITEPVVVPAGILDESRCPETVMGTPDAAPMATMAATEASEMATAPATAASSPAPTVELSGKTLTGAVAIDVKDFAFHPAEIRIRVGTVVTWTNSDVVAHTATATNPQGAFNSGNLNHGQSYSFTFDTAGTYDYFCSYHPFMTGKIIVVDE